MTPSHTELAPGIHRLGTVEDGKRFGYHVLDGATGPVLVDTGTVDVPKDVYRPFLESTSRSLADVDTALITHADADHFGGNHALRSANPGVTIAAHAADVPWIESAERIMDERYARFEESDGVTYDDGIAADIRSMMGPDEPVDLALRGGETIRVRDRRLRVLQTPGHTEGHVMLYDPAADLLLGADGFFGRGLFSVDGDLRQPPPYYHFPEYENTIHLVDALDPDTLSFTHYEVMRGDSVDDFVSESLNFVAELEAIALDVVDEFGTVTLEEAIEAVVDRRGSFGLDLDLAAPLSAHYADLADRGVLRESECDGRRDWTRP